MHPSPKPSRRPRRPRLRPSSVNRVWWGVRGTGSGVPNNLSITTLSGLRLGWHAPLVLNFRKPETAFDSPDQFIADLVPVWGRVERFEIYRVRKGEPTIMATTDVVHVSGEPETPDADVRQIRMFLEDDAKARGEPTRYQVIARGTKPGAQVKGAKGRTVTQEIPNAELASWTPRFGDVEVSEKAPSDPLAAITSFLKSVPDIYNGGIVAADAAMKLHISANAALTAENNALRAENTALRQERNQGDEFRFKLAELQVNAAAQERAEHREDQRHAAEAEQKAATIEKAMGTISGLMQMIVEDRKQEREARAREQAASETASSAPPAPPPAPPKQHVGAALKEALQHMSEKQHERMSELCGHVLEEESKDPKKVGRKGLAIWEVIVGASKQATHEEAVATLNNIVASQKVASHFNGALRTATEEGILTVEQANVVVGALRYVTKR